MRNGERTRRVALSGLLVAVMLIMGYVESLIPLTTGIPGVKPGLSNGVLIFAVFMLDIPLTYCLMFLKVLLTGLMFGGISAMLYSLAGGLLSLTAMCLLHRLPFMRSELIGMAGGMLHNVGQVAMAMVVLRTRGLLGYLGVLIPVGLACGLLTGFLADLVMKRLKITGNIPKTEHKKGGLLTAIIAMILMLATLAAIFIGNPNLRPGAAENTEVEWGNQGVEINVLPGRISK